MKKTFYNYSTSHYVNIPCKLCALLILTTIDCISKLSQLMSFFLIWVNSAVHHLLVFWLYIHGQIKGVHVLFCWAKIFYNTMMIQIQWSKVSRLVGCLLQIPNECKHGGLEVQRSMDLWYFVFFCICVEIFGKWFFLEYASGISTSIA